MTATFKRRCDGHPILCVRDPKCGMDCHYNTAQTEQELRHERAMHAAVVKHTAEPPVKIANDYGITLRPTRRQQFENALFVVVHWTGIGALLAAVGYALGMILGFWGR